MTDKKREEYIEEKAREFKEIAHYKLNSPKVRHETIKDFIRIMLDEAPKSKVSKEWIQTLIYVCDDIEDGQMSIENLHEMLKEVGVGVED